MGYSEMAHIPDPMLLIQESYQVMGQLMNQLVQDQPLQLLSKRSQLAQILA